MDKLSFSEKQEETRMITRLARQRGVTFEKATQLMASSDLQRNTKGAGLPVSGDVAKFRLAGQ